MSRSNATQQTPQDSVRTGLIGRQIGASRSPWLHEREAQAQGLALSYTLFDFAALGMDESHLAAQLAAAEKAGYAGVNITYPYKQAVIELLDELSPEAARIGAVNTVKFSVGKRVGHNTDVVGFAESMRTGLPNASLERVLQLGAGGGGAATAQALLELGVRSLFVSDQHVDRATTLARRLQDGSNARRVVAIDDPLSVIETVDGIVNATPMGMVANPRAPIDTSRLSSRQWVADIVYFPIETELLRAARARGCATLDGSRMAVYQAASAFEIFTGRKADRARMLASFIEFSGTVPAQTARR
ncbi:MAG TPA: shikimate dehydrogenase [Gammaproteobacteria bacterium]|nr:shikimate dehydrogenase [Gammaproteobacteria bacterium]